MDAFPIIDLHCDLLYYFTNPLARAVQKRTAHALELHCSIPQLSQGRVALQTLAIYTRTGQDSVSSGLKQSAIFAGLHSQYPNDISRITNGSLRQDLTSDSSIKIVAAIENASGFCDESQSFESGLENLERIIAESGPLLYLSLTWCAENRFGGGDQTKIGLKEDGKRLLDYLGERKIAIDLSHTSDALGHDILNYIDKQSLPLRVMASHSLLRAVNNVPRNLPDELAKEIVRRKGVIGLNSITDFVGADSLEKFADHLRHALSCGGQQNVAFGADFYCEDDIPESNERKVRSDFLSLWNDSSAYPRVLNFLQSVGIEPSILQRLANENAQRFINELWG